MRLLGILVLAAGIAVGMFGLAMDTTVATSAGEQQRGYLGLRSDREEPVADAALVARRRVWLWVGGLLAVAGLVMAVVKVKPAGEEYRGEDSGDAMDDDAWVVEHELHKKDKRQRQQPVYEQRYEEEDEEDIEEEEERKAAMYLIEEKEYDEQDDEEPDDVHSITATLIKLNELRKEGVLTNEEFNEQKAKLLRKR